MRARTGGEDTVDIVISHLGRSFHTGHRHRAVRCGLNRIRSRRRRAATLVVTVLMAVAVASIAMVVIKLVVGSAQESTRRFAVQAATRSADGVREQVRAELVADPLAPYTRVLASEHPRVCTTASTTTLIQPGASWPAACGTVWSYERGGLTVGTRITLPSPEDPAMTVKVASRIGDISAGYADRYIIGGRNRPVLYSGSELDLTELRKDASGAKVDGFAYAVGDFDTVASSVDSSSAVLVTESAFSPSPTGSSASTITGRRFAALSPQSSTANSPAVLDVRDVYRSVLPSSGIRAAATAVEQIACPGGPSRLVSVAANTYATHLCLHAGEVLVNSLGEPVTVPAAVAYLLLPTASSARTVDVYVRTTSFTVPGLPCDEADIENEIPACDLAELSSGGMAAGTHPGSISGWQALGTFPLPASGVAATDADTHIGLCGSGFVSGTCSSWSGGSVGVQVDRPFTVVVGTPSSARDLYLSGPVTSAGGQLGAIVTGSVVVPYWARPVGLNVSFDISLAVAGEGGTAIHTIPSSAPALQGNSGGSITINGAVGANNFEVSVSEPVFSGYRILAALGPEDAPPLFALPSLVFERDTSRKLTAAELDWLEPVTVQVDGSTATSVNLSWGAPQLAAGVTVTGYDVEYRRVGDSIWSTYNVVGTTTTTASISDLASGSDYHFRVVVSLSAGKDVMSRSVTTTTQSGPPGAPRSLRSNSSTSSSVTIVWSPPAANGGSTITDYIIQFKPSSTTAWSTFADGTSTATTATVSGLDAGTGYDFRVAATSALGTGNNSSAVSAETAAP